MTLAAAHDRDERRPRGADRHARSRSTTDPATTFVAGFIGSPPMNFLPAQARRRRVDVGGGVRVPLPAELRASAPRGGHRRRAPRAPGGRRARAGPLFRFKVETVEALGADSLVHGAHRRRHARRARRRAHDARDRRASWCSRPPPASSTSSIPPRASACADEAGRAAHRGAAPQLLRAAGPAASTTAGCCGSSRQGEARALGERGLPVAACRWTTKFALLRAALPRSGRCPRSFASRRSSPADARRASSNAAAIDASTPPPWRPPTSTRRSLGGASARAHGAAGLGRCRGRAARLARGASQRASRAHRRHAASSCARSHCATGGQVVATGLTILEDDCVGPLRHRHACRRAAPRPRAHGGRHASSRRLGTRRAPRLSAGTGGQRRRRAGSIRSSDSRSATCTGIAAGPEKRNDRRRRDAPRARGWGRA